MSRIQKSNFDWYYTRWAGIASTRVIKVWAKLFRTPCYRIELTAPIDKSTPIVIASNHQTLLDPPAMFGALPLSDVRALSPIKFMTWHKYYNSFYKLPLYSTGCYPSHGDGLAGVTGGVTYARQGYSSFIFPEGKRTNPGNRKSAYRGVSEILAELPEARLLLIHIDWEKRVKKLSRPKLTVTVTEAPNNLDRTNPDAIMDAIYSL